MPVITQVDREEVVTVMADNMHTMHLTGSWLEAAYFTENADGEKRVDPGLILAKETNTGKYVPYHASALYGVGSDTAVGILDWGPQFVTHDEVGVSPAFHGKAIEAHCYVWGGARGTISNTIKTHLNMIEWV